MTYRSGYVLEDAVADHCSISPLLASEVDQTSGHRILWAKREVIVSAYTRIDTIL